MLTVWLTEGCRQYFKQLGLVIGGGVSLCMLIVIIGMWVDGTLVCVIFKKKSKVQISIFFFSGRAAYLLQTFTKN